MQWAIVTGADGGIGMEFCRELARRDFSLLMVSNRQQELTLAAARIEEEFPGVKTLVLSLDLTAFDAPQKILSFVKFQNIRPSLLINNAGIFSFAPVVETSDRKIGCFISLHIGATVALSKEFARYFATQGGGRILNMSSMSCWMPMPGIAMYSATKSFIRVFSRALHYEMRDSGVTVTVACPGGIATGLFGLPPKLLRLAVRIGAIERPEKFAAKAIKKTLKGKKQYINGITNRLAILLIALTPTAVRMQIKRRMLDKGVRV